MHGAKIIFAYLALGATWPVTFYILRRCHIYLSRDIVARVRDFIARESRRRCDCRVARCDFVV